MFYLMCAFGSCILFAHTANLKQSPHRLTDYFGRKSAPYFEFERLDAAHVTETSLEFQDCRLARNIFDYLHPAGRFASKVQFFSHLVFFFI